MDVESVNTSDYKRLSAIIENLSVSYNDYMSSNAQFMIDNMTRKLNEINPETGKAENYTVLQWMTKQDMPDPSSTKNDLNEENII